MNLQEELKVLKERIAELEEQVKGEQEFPRDGDDYWYIDDEGDILNESWDGLDFEEHRLVIGNVFRTKGEAEFAVEKLKVEAELRKFSRPFRDDEENHFIELYLFDKTLSLDYEDNFPSQGTIYYESKEKVLQAVASVGEERIKKYIFGVED